MLGLRERKGEVDGDRGTGTRCEEECVGVCVGVCVRVCVCVCVCVFIDVGGSENSGTREGKQTSRPHTLSLLLLLLSPHRSALHLSRSHQCPLRPLLLYRTLFLTTSTAALLSPLSLFH